MKQSEPLPATVARSLSWQDAHAGFEDAVRDFPVDARGRRPADLPHSAWQLLEHLRRAQRDILDFCVATPYVTLDWPDDYWPEEAEPPDAASWDQSVAAFLADRAELASLARRLDLATPVPNGDGQTYGRELILAADHAAYHVGQLVLLRRLLGCWPP